MLKIRMQRVGRINQPAYRIVVIEHTSSTKAGKFVEKVGTYNPRTKVRSINEDRVKYWMSVGAQPSATMHNMLIGAGVISGKKINILPAYKAPAEAAASEAEVEAQKAAEHAAKEAAKAAHDAQVAAEAAEKEAAEKAAPENVPEPKEAPAAPVAEEAPKTE
jgi:small subunit ribosomal protein S16